MMDNQIDRELLEKIADMLGKPVGAFNIRKDSGCDKIKYLSAAPMFAEAIERIYQEISIAKLFN